MSSEKRQHECNRWLAQADADLRAAEISASGESYEWACFQAQQSAEKALKALWLADGHDPWGHSLLRLVREHPAASTKEKLTTAVSEAAATLDQFYIPTRYPNGLPDLTPHEVYTKDQAQRAREAAIAVIELVRQLLTR